MQVIDGKRQKLERRLLKAMLTHGAEKRAADLNQRLAPRGRGKLALASGSVRDAVPANEATSDRDS